MSNEMCPCVADKRVLTFRSTVYRNLYETYYHIPKNVFLMVCLLWPYIH